MAPYHGKKETPTPSPHRRGRPYLKKGKSGGAQKRAIVALVERGGEVRVTHMPKVTSKNIREFAVKHADRQSRLHTDESNLYPSWLLLGSGVVLGLSRNQVGDEGTEQGFATAARVVHELEEAEVKRQLVLRDAPVRAGANTTPEPNKSVKVSLLL